MNKNSKFINVSNFSELRKQRAKAILEIAEQNRWLGMIKQNVREIKSEVPKATQEIKNVISPID